MSDAKFSILKDMFPNYATSGAIFSKMPKAPWVATESSLEMDIVYFGSFSGIKAPAMLPYEFLQDGVIDQQKLADIIWNIFGRNWQKLWDAYMSDYDPLENYNISDKTERSETIERDIKKDEKGEYKGEAAATTTNNLSTKVDETDTTKVTYGQIIDSDQTSNTYTHAFNTVDSVPTGVMTTNNYEKHSGDDVTNLTIDGTTKNTGTVAVESSDKSNTNNNIVTDDDIKDSETIERKRSGNIGQNTFQELLRQEFELWKWSFYLQVFEDCDRFLVLPYYGSYCSQTVSRFNTVN